MEAAAQQRLDAGEQGGGKQAVGDRWHGQLAQAAARLPDLDPAQRCGRPTAVSEPVGHAPGEPVGIASGLLDTDPVAAG